MTIADLRAALDLFNRSPIHANRLLVVDAARRLVTEHERTVRRVSRCCVAFNGRVIQMRPIEAEMFDALGRYENRVAPLYRMMEAERCAKTINVHVYHCRRILRIRDLPYEIINHCGEGYELRPL